MLTSSGRPKRRTRKVVNYTETGEDTSQDLEKYFEMVYTENEQRSVQPAHNSAAH